MLTQPVIEVRTWSDSPAVRVGARIADVLWKTLQAIGVGLWLFCKGMWWLTRPVWLSFGVVAVQFLRLMLKAMWWMFVAMFVLMSGFFVLVLGGMIAAVFQLPRPRRRYYRCLYRRF